MTFEEYAAAVDTIRAEYPERPTESQWSDFFKRVRDLGPSLSDYLEHYTLQRSKQRAGLV